MAIRIETKTIPAEIIEIAVISIPASEWRMSNVKSFMFGLFGIILGLVWFFGLMMIDSLKLSNHFSFDILHSGSDALKWTAVVMVASLPIFFLIYKLFRWSSSTLPTLLKKHGWDGTSRYRVELSQGGAWFD